MMISTITRCGCQCNNTTCFHAEFELIRNRCSHCGYENPDEGTAADWRTRFSAKTGALDVKVLNDGRIAYLYRTITAYRILVEGDCPSEEWMLAEMMNTTANVIFRRWDGYDSPDYWVRHKVAEQTRRRDPITGKVYVTTD